MSDKTKLGDRMKEYEYVTRTNLIKKVPVIIRLDGKAFHTFTRGMKRPFDSIMSDTMQQTMKYLCENIQGCILGYTQSDEITLVLIDYQSQNSDMWFGGNIQKICSISASMATLAFNRKFIQNVYKLGSIEKDSGLDGYFDKLKDKFNRAMFDSRVFQLPKEEVINCLIWRQQDATRNSIQSVGQANFSHKELHGKSVNKIQDMLMLDKGTNWNDFPIENKRGTCAIRKQFVINEGTKNEAIRCKWVIDKDIPIFTQYRNYIEDLVYVNNK